MTTSTTLSEIWRSWGMRPSNDEAKAQKKALAALKKHLGSGSAALVRGAQALLLDPEKPGVAKRPLLGMFWRIVDPAWSSAGTAETHLLALQAMLIACWPEGSDNLGIVSSLLSPWEQLRGREQQKERLVQWRDERATEGLSEEEAEDTVDLSKLSGACDALLKHRVGKLEEGVRVNGYHNVQIVMTSESGGLLRKNIVALSGIIRKFAQSTLVALEDTVESLQAPQEAPLRELLWWGQARYSHLARKPFRRIDDPAKALWFAAREAAERACNLPIEPSASYLQETLFSLGHSPSEKKTLWQWLRELRPLINEHPEDPPLGADLLELVREDALGLPVTRLCADSTVSDDDLKNALGAPQDAELDAGQWAAWIFRELVFQRRWRGSST